MKVRIVLGLVPEDFAECIECDDAKLIPQLRVQGLNEQGEWLPKSNQVPGVKTPRWTTLYHCPPHAMPLAEAAAEIYSRLPPLPHLFDKYCRLYGSVPETIPVLQEWEDGECRESISQ